jgi:hypothetical protein
MIRTILLVAALIAITPEKATAMIDIMKYSEKLYKPIAIVENYTITEEDLKQKMSIMAMSGLKLTREEAINNIINQVVILNSQKNKQPPQELINHAIRTIATENGISQVEFNQMLKKFDIKSQHLTQHIAAQLILNEMVIEQLKEIPQTKRDLYNKSIVTKKQIEETDKLFSQPIIEYIFNKDSQVKLAEIIVKQGKNLQSIVEMLRQNESFTKIKNQFPNDVELAAQDGIIGWLNFNDMSDLYKTVVKNIKINEIGQPLTANNSFLFIKLLDKKNVTEIKKYINKDYLNLSFKYKAEQLQNKSLGVIISQNIIHQLKQQLYIEIL